MFSLWTVIYFYFSSSLMIFSLRIMGLETCACGFIFLSCVVFPSFFVVLLLLLLLLLLMLLLMCSLSCVFAPDFSSLLSAHFLSHPSPLSVCLFCDVTPSPPSQKTRTPPVRQTQVCPFFCFAFLIFLDAVSQLLSVGHTLLQEQFTQNWNLIYHLYNLRLAEPARNHQKLMNIPADQDAVCA